MDCMSDGISQAQIFRVRLQVGLLDHVVMGMAAEVMLEQCQGHHQWNNTAVILLDQALHFFFIRRAQRILQITKQVIQDVAVGSPGSATLECAHYTLEVVRAQLLWIV